MTKHQYQKLILKYGEQRAALIQQGEKAFENIVDLLSTLQKIDWKNDPNLVDTPYRLAKSLFGEKLASYSELQIDQQDNIFINFPSAYDGMIISGPTRCFSLCPHHLEQIEYLVWVGYIPTERVLGLSKIPKIIKQQARQPLLQEDFTNMLVEIFFNNINPEGCGVVVRGQHGCMLCRGESVNVEHWITTAQVLGSFRDHAGVKSEFLKYIELQVSSGR